MGDFGPEARSFVGHLEPGEIAPRQDRRAAALKAVAGGTIIRVETDSDGSPFEAHVRKADGTEVVVKMDNDFEVTATEDHAMKADRPARPAV